jgi:hypothetical protein
MQEYDQCGAAAPSRSGLNGVFLLRSDRLRRLPPAGRRSFGSTLAIEGYISQYPPNSRWWSTAESAMRQLANSTASSQVGFCQP